MHYSMLQPVLALALWTLVMCGWLYATRIPAINRHGIVFDPSQLPHMFHSQLPPHVRWKADNYNNLLEQPTLFYAVALVLAAVDLGSRLDLGLAWTYVGLRVAHSLVQATINQVMPRFLLFAAGTVVLLVMVVRASLIVF